MKKKYKSVQRALRMILVFAGMFTIPCQVSASVSSPKAVKVTTKNGNTGVSLMADGSLWSWGPLTGSDYPTEMGIIRDWVDIDGNLFIRKGGTLWKTSLGGIPMRIYNAGPVWVSISSYGDDKGSTDLALKNDGTLWTTAITSIGVKVVPVGSDSDWAKIAAGDFSMAIKNNGTLWGWNLSAPTPSPAPVGTDNDWVDVESGLGGAYAIKSDGTLWAWNGDWDSPAMSQFGGDNDWLSIDVGEFHVVAVKSDGTLWSWGENSYGTLGDGTQMSRSSPLRIGTDTDWAMGAASLCEQTTDYQPRCFTVALKNDGSLWTWGSNYATQLGFPSSEIKPVPVGGEANWISLAGGYAHTLALKSDGSLWVWGSNYHATLGDGTQWDKEVPLQIGSKNWASVAAGKYFNLGIQGDGTLWSWGKREYLGLGTGGGSYERSPVQVGATNDWERVAVGLDHSLAIRGGALMAWGQNGSGQLGDGKVDPVTSPKRIGSDNNWISVKAGDQFSLGLKSDGSLWSWGKNDYGQLGIGVIGGTSWTPNNLNSPQAWSSVTAASYEKVAYSIALTNNGELWAWGGHYDYWAGSVVANPIATQVGGDSNWIAAYGAVAPGIVNYGSSNDSPFVMLLKADGTLWRWSGWGTNTIQIGSDSNWSVGGMGGSHRVAINGDGSLYSWGSNSRGQLGNGKAWELTPHLAMTGTLLPKPQNIFVGQEAGASELRVYDGAGNRVRSIVAFGAANSSGSVRLVRGDVNGDGVDEIIAGHEGGNSEVRVYDSVTGARLLSFVAFGATNISGSVRLVTGDVDGNGTDEIIVGHEGGNSEVRVYDGQKGTRLLSFVAFGAGNTSGSVRLAMGDVDGNGTDEIITGQEGGTSEIRVYDGRTGARNLIFTAFGGGNTSGSVRLATGDVDGNGTDEIITGQELGNSEVRVYDGVSGARLLSFVAFGAGNVSGSVRLTTGDVDGNGTDEIITGQEGGASEIRVYDGVTGSRSLIFTAFGGGNTSGSVRLVTADIDGDGADEIITGQEGGASEVRIYDGVTGTRDLSFVAFGSGNTSGSVRLTTGMPY